MITTIRKFKLNLIQKFKVKDITAVISLIYVPSDSRIHILLK